jgi:nucleotidyltransferase AbiEii toxin of type IV toxin-antitoxin system
LPVSRLGRLQQDLLEGFFRREKLVLHGIRVDPPEEIFANKLCALLSRAEVRDLVDARALERAGLSVEAAVRGAATKDTGLTPAQLAWVLSEIRIPPDAEIPGGVTASELAEFIRDLVTRLGKMAFRGADADTIVRM